MFKWNLFYLGIKVLIRTAPFTVYYYSADSGLECRIMLQL